MAIESCALSRFALLHLRRTHFTLDHVSQRGFHVLLLHLQSEKNPAELDQGDVRGSS